MKTKEKYRIVSRRYDDGLWYAVQENRGIIFNDWQLLEFYENKTEFWLERKYHSARRMVYVPRFQTKKDAEKWLQEYKETLEWK